MKCFMLCFYIALFSIPTTAESQNNDITVVQDAGNFYLLHNENVNPIEARRSYNAHHTLLNIKRSIAFGRAGFRPGKRTVAIYDF